MLYSEYIDKMKRIALIESDDTDMYYIRPDYAYLAEKAGLKLSKVTDYEGVTSATVLEELKLERDMRNMRRSKIPFLINWLYSVLTTTVDPAMIEEENKMAKEILSNRNKPEENVADISEETQLKIDAQNKINEMNLGFNFAKREP